MVPILTAACGGGSPTRQAVPVTTAGPTSAPPEEAKQDNSSTRAGTPFRNATYSYEVVVPPGWELDRRDEKSVVLRAPKKDLAIVVAVYVASDLSPAPASLSGYREAWLAVMRSAMPGFTIVKEEQTFLGQDEGLVYEYTWVDRGTKLRAKALLVRRADFSYEVFGWVPEQAWQEFLPFAEGLFESFKPG